MAALPRDCPCRSGLRYAACCGPFHRGAREAETPEALMRSRFAAFALGLGDYLVRTIGEGHPDRSAPPAELARAYCRVRETQRFMDLRILEASADADHGEVLFFARIFERGADRSFAELSSFARERGAWRYVEGVLVPRAALPDALEGLTRGAFLALAEAISRP